VRILCPTDGSARAAAAIDKLIASFAADEVVVDLLAVAGGRLGPSTRHAGTDHAVRLAQHLDGERARLEAAGFEVAASVRTGHAADEIVAFADATRPDVVILGSRSADGDGHGYSGRVAGTVARHCHAPVLIARDGQPVERIVLGYDESPDADAALTLLAGFPYRSAPAVAVCSTWEIGDTLLPSTLGGEAALHHQAAPQDLAESRLAGEDIARDAADRLRRDGLAATPYARHGRASAELEILAAEVNADLIVVGSRGISSVERFLLGSTSDELVATARISVLVVRS
jgi:nucleotide-binding universal stress UspA family protein